MPTAFDRLRHEMQRQGLAALVALSPENVAYAIGYMVPSHPNNRARRTITVLTADGRAVLIVVSVEAELARQQSRIQDVRSYDQFREVPMDVLAGVLRELKVANGPLGMELDFLPALDYLRLREHFPSVDFQPNRELYLRARFVKGPEEVRALREIARISDVAEEAAWREVREGMTEKQLAALITATVLNEGGDGLRLLVGAGERSGIVNPKPTDRAIRRGDVIRVEVLANLNNYQSNVTRTGVIGRPTDEQRRIWRVLMDARAAALERLGPGVVVRELWRAYADVCAKGGVEPSLAFLGHGIGLTGHEEPYITADKDLVLEPGVVLTYEPFHMVPGRMGFHIEDMFLITERGYENLTTVTTNEELIEAGGALKITDLEIIRVAVPRRRVHRMASMTAAAGRYVVVRLATDAGVDGLGEATVMREWGGDHGVYYGESPGTTLTVLQDDLFPAIKGRDPFDVEQILEVMDRTIKGYPYAKAAIDLALHDIIGKKSGLPVHQLLGGCYRDRIPLAQSLGIMDTDQAVAEAVQAVGEGIRTLKIKVGLDVAHDEDVVREVRAAVGPRIAITLDANQAYATPKTAIQQIRRLERHDLLLVEQPTQGLDEMAQVTAAVDTWIMADESAWTPRDVLKIAERRAADCISIYTTKPGGLFRARQVAAVAEAAGLPCNVNGSGELGVGNAGNVHLSASARIISLACVYPATAPAEKAPTRIAGRQYVDDIVNEALEYADGYVLVPRRPGLGVSLDPEKIAKYRVA